MLKDKIRELANAKCMTLRDVAEKSGVPYAAIKEWNTSMPNALALVKVCEVVGTTAEQLLKEE